MVTSLKVIADVFAEPSQAFRALKAETRWFLAFVVVSLIFMGAAWFIIPYMQELSFDRMAASGMAEAQLEQARTMGEKFAFVGLIFVPIQVLLKALVFGAILYFTCRLLGAEGLEFKLAWATIIHAELILVLAGIINAGLLPVFRDIGDVQQVSDLTLLPGIHYLFGATENVVLSVFLSQINISAIWYVPVLGIGVAVIAGFSKAKAGMVAGSIWLLSIVAQSALMALQG